MKNTWINIAAVAIVIVLAYFGYRYLFGAPAETATGITVQTGATTDEATTAEVDTTTAVATSTSVDITNASQQFTTLLNSIKGIDFKRGTILQSRVFSAALQDFSKALPVKSVGRTNPFAPADDSIDFSTTTKPMLPVR